MADTEPNNPPLLEDQQQTEINPINLTEPLLIEDDDDEELLHDQIEEIIFDDDPYEDYEAYLLQFLAGVGRADRGLETPSERLLELVAGVSDDEDDEDYVDDDDDDYDDDDVDDDEEESDDDDDDDVEEEEENGMVTSPRARVSVDLIGGGEVASEEKWRREAGEIDGLMCPICMGAWTSGGDHQVCCLPCGHIYGLSCIRKWLEHRKGSAKCPQCNRKCKPKDVRVLYASRVVVADEESKEKIRFLEAKCALLEKANAHLHMKNADLQEVVDLQSKQVATQTERVQYLIDTQQSQIDALKADQKAYEQRVLQGMAAAGIDAPDWPRS